MDNFENKDLFSIDENWLEPQKGRILISEPFSGERIFEKSVVLIIEHNQHGTAGFILNKPLASVRISILNTLEKFPHSINLGGPVEIDKLFFIHSVPELISGSIEIVDGIYYGGNFKSTVKLIEEGKISSRQIKFFAGYAGWNAGQLTDEISKKFWMVGKLNPETIMDNQKDIWKEAVATMGDRYKIWENLPADPSLN